LFCFISLSGPRRLSPDYGKGDFAIVNLIMVVASFCLQISKPASVIHDSSSFLQSMSHSILLNFSYRTFLRQNSSSFSTVPHDPHHGYLTRANGTFLVSLFCFVFFFFMKSILPCTLLCSEHLHKFFRQLTSLVQSLAIAKSVLYRCPTPCFSSTPLASGFLLPISTKSSELPKLRCHSSPRVPPSLLHLYRFRAYPFSVCALLYCGVQVRNPDCLLQQMARKLERVPVK
jgi:hypothetical protein